MARICEICGKKPLTGNNVSHSNNRNKRRFLPNLQTVRVLKNGQRMKLKLCTSCIKTARAR